jgi:hypothetical protein
MPIHVTTSTTQSLSNKTFVDRVSTTGVVYASSGNSDQWSSAYSSVYATSANWDSTYTSVNTNSAKYDSVYTTTNTKSANWDSTYTTVSAITGNLVLGQLGISIDGAGSVIATGVKQYLRVPYNCTITSYEIVAKPSGSITIDILKSTYEDFPPAASITGGNNPTITSNTKFKGNPTSWTTTFLTAGEYLGFNVTFATAITAATLTLTTLR